MGRSQFAMGIGWGVPSGSRFYGHLPTGGGLGQVKCFVS
jgi:hypothetical protein